MTLTNAEMIRVLKDRDRANELIKYLRKSLKKTRDEAIDIIHDGGKVSDTSMIKVMDNLLERMHEYERGE